jgi:thiamine biosynthesis lipoprotein
MEVAEHRGRVMASELHVVIVDPRPDQLERALVHLDHLEQRWSRFLPDSDISRMNSSGGATLSVDDETLVLLATMLEAHADTDGLFDPTILPWLIDLGYAFSKDDPSAATVLPAGFFSASVAQLELDAARGVVRVPPGLALDPGGIGKGLAADLVVRRLIDDGAAGALVSIGGDLALAGVAPDVVGWSIGVEHPDPKNGLLCTLTIDGGGIATSSTRSRRWLHGADEVHHLIDPRVRRMSDTDLAAVTVIASTGWAAEAHATAALLQGSAGAIDYLARHELIGLAVTLEGTVVTTRELDFVSEQHIGASR